VVGGGGVAQDLRKSTILKSSIGVCAMAKLPVEKTAVSRNVGAAKPRVKSKAARKIAAEKPAAKKVPAIPAGRTKAAKKVATAVVCKAAGVRPPAADKKLPAASIEDGAARLKTIGMTDDAIDHDAARAELWAQAELDYADPKIKVSEIAKRVGLATIVFNSKVNKLGWPPRTPVNTSALNGGTSGKARTPIELVRRVYKTIDGELTKLEVQAGDTSQDRERASRALSQMVNSLEKAIEMQREITKDTTKGAAKKNKEELAHAEDLRRAIAERIERLQSKRVPDAGSAGADGE
jgi:hypothetical protein